jgi:hopanoid-associated phosphorylase
MLRRGQSSIAAHCATRTNMGFRCKAPAAAAKVNLIAQVGRLGHVPKSAQNFGSSAVSRDAAISSACGCTSMIITVVGLAFEARVAARIAPGAGMQVICNGTNQTLATSLAEAIAKGCDGLISFGVAGGLSPQLKPGTCVVGSTILSGPARFPTDADWSGKLLRCAPDAVYGVIAGVSAPMAQPSAKHALHIRTGAIAVDMESHIVASVGAAHGLPVAAIRTIADPAQRILPQAVLVAVRPNGTTDVTAMLRWMTRRPRDLPGLLRIALDASAARRTLLRDGQALLACLGIANARKTEVGCTGDEGRVFELCTKNVEPCRPSYS